MKFPNRFLWGGDISAAQCEGAWNVDGRGPTETDYMTLGGPNKYREITFQHADGTLGSMPVVITADLPQGAKYTIHPGVHYPNHDAIKHYEYMKQDIALFAELGINSLNLTISWARIYPRGVEGGINQKGVDFYREELLECKKYGIEPIVTLYKYDMPVYLLEKYGGWKNRKLIDEFVEFSRLCFEEYKGLVKYWITFNEINIELMTSKTKEDYKRALIKLHHQLLASAKAVQLAHSISKEYLVGSMNCGVTTYPYTCSPEDQYANLVHKQEIFYYSSDVQARGYYPNYAKKIWQKYDLDSKFFEKEKEILKFGKVDYFAFSYYSTSCWTSNVEGKEHTAGNIAGGVKNPYLSTSDWGWQIDPIGLKTFLHELYDRYQMPLLIVENGLGANEKMVDYKIHDDYHVEYLRKHIQSFKEAIDEGVDLFGYTMWSIIDLCAASTGQISKRYGFIYVDADDCGNGDFQRYKKDSFAWYKKVIQSNGEDLD